MQLGGAIGPLASTQMAQVFEEAVSQVLREKGDTAVLFRQVMEGMTAIVVKLTAIADQQQAASQSLASAAKSLAAERGRLEIPAPIVNVPAPTVTVMESPETERGVKKTVHRDAQGLITHITEEPM